MLRVIGDDQAVVRLEPRAMKVLVYLVEHTGKVISRAELEEKIWEGRIVGEDALTNTISKLRRAFADNARHPKIIETLPKTGYRLIADVDWIDVPSGPGKRSALPGHFWTRLLVILAVVGGAAMWWVAQQHPVSSLEVSVKGDRLDGIPSVAIMPFLNLGEKPEQDYFANGITTNLITDLSKISGLLVIAQGSVFSYQGSSFGTKDISRELNADYIVRGSVQRQGERVRVNTQLIEAANERALWAERYDGELVDVFKLQDQIATSLVAALRIELAPGERNIFSRYPTASVQAYDLFLRGLEEYGHRTPDSNSSARTHFEQAIELDPKFARAAAGLALVHSRDAIDGWTTTPDQSLDRALELVGIAADLNPAIPQVHFVAGQVALFRGLHAEAIEATRRAIHYSPNYADAYALLAWILNYAGQPDEALAVLETATRLNPVIPASYSEILGEIHFSQGNYTDALAEFERALQINPTHMRARMWLVTTLAQTDALDEARWQAGELTLLNPDFSLARLRYAFPFVDPSVRDKLLDGLRQAGLPEEI
jgi:adenylate cyclase